MGAVYEAEDAATGRRVAVKLISPSYAGSAESAARFRKEGRLAGRIVHPRCVHVLKVDEEAGRPYIVMELMPGQTLQDLVQQNGPLPVAEAVAKILDVVDGLREAHRHKVIHRDVKPSNCFLEANGRVKVGDFGLAKSLVDAEQLTRAGTFLGTPLYAAPEQVQAEPLDQQSDLYSVAATLYFLLAGRAPHQSGDPAATMARIVLDDAPSLRGLRPDVPPELDRVVLRGLERSRSKRWGDLGEFRKALQPFRPARGLAGRLAALLTKLVGKALPGRP
jgi:serine/threonine protein kinase